MSESTIDGLIEGGAATAGPPLGPALGPMGINVNEVIAEINKKTAAFSGIKVPVKVIVETSTKTFRIEVGMPPTSALLLKEINVQKGAKAKGEVVGNVTLEQIKKIVEAKGNSIYGAGIKEKVKQVLGTCVSMGITCENISAKEFTKKIDSGEVKL